MNEFQLVLITVCPIGYELYPFLLLNNAAVFMFALHVLHQLSFYLKQIMHCLISVTSDVSSYLKDFILFLVARLKFI